jgi:Cd2+/Zn2+-exporting ATPase
MNEQGVPARHELETPTALTANHSIREKPTAGGGGRYSFKVQGLDCAEEVAVLRSEVGPLVGGEDNLAFDVLSGRMTVLDSAPSISPGEIISAVRRTGMTAVEWRREEKESSEASERRRRQQVWFTSLSGLSVAAGFAIHVWLAGGVGEGMRLLAGHEGEATPLPEAVAYALAVAFGVRFVIVKAWSAVRGLRADMNLLMVVAVAGAIAIGQWFEAATVTFLFALSLTLESWSVARARRAIAALLDLAPPTVRLIRTDGSEADVAAAEVKPGDRFIVRAGERIALDGVVMAGSSSVNQAPITGESVPVEKAPGAEVFAGTVNGDGALTVEAAKTAENTMLARIIRLVEEAHAGRAPSEQWVERFARVYTPAVMGLAILVFLGPPLALGGAWHDWFYRALVLLVIACPCALVISTPVSIVAALASSAREGVLVKGGAYIELPGRLKAIAMDKTGTVTRGEPEVVRVLPFGAHTEAELLARAAALEARSTHPLARAILRHAEAQGIAPAPATDVQVLKGKGLTGTFDGEQFWLGSHRYVVERGQNTAQSAEQAQALEADGNTVIVVGNPRHVCGLIAVADTIRPEARDIVQQLRAVGIAHIVMLTGDNRVTAEAIARAVGMDEVYAELSPEDKVKKVEELVGRYETVAMVGDGVNDAPALARANLGIAMGAIGSDAAIETADVALMTDDISKLPWLVRHAKRTLAIIRQNIVFSLGVKAIFIGLTFAGFATLWGAIAADMGASLVVVVNALRLLRPRDVKTKAESVAERPYPVVQSRKGIVWTISAAMAAILVGAILVTYTPDFLTPEPRPSAEIEPAPPQQAAPSVVAAPPKETMEPRATTEPTPAPPDGYATKNLPNGVELTISKSGVEAKLLAFIENEAKRSKIAWFDLDRLTFEKGETKPLASSKEQLQNVAKILVAYPRVKAIIGSHTDNLGAAVTNRTLSKARAMFVRRELRQMGVGASRLQAKGYGESDPVATNATDEGRAKNRRISLGVVRK